MTVKEQLCLMADASDAGEKRIGIYRPSILKATRRKNGDTAITFGLVVAEFTVEDILHNRLGAWLAVGDIKRVQELEQTTSRLPAPAAAPEQSWRCGCGELNSAARTDCGNCGSDSTTRCDPIFQKEPK